MTKNGPQSVTALTGPIQHETERLRLDELMNWPVQQVPLELRDRPAIGGDIGDFDVLFHLAAYVRTEDDSPDVRINDDGTQRLLDELGVGLRDKHVVFTSSVSAVDTTRTRGGWMEPATVCWPRTEYGRSKLRGEEIIQEESVRLGFTYSILRLPLVYGAGYRPSGMFGFFHDQLPRKTLGSRLPWPGRISVVEVSDLAHILAEAGVRDEMRGKTFFVSSSEDPSMAELAEEAANCLGVSYKPLPIGKPLFRLASGLGKLLSAASFLPHAVRILGWRVSLVVDGFCCDGSELTQLLRMEYSPWKQSMRHMYDFPDLDVGFSVEPLVKDEVAS